jgi:hypothetical protein
MSKPFFAYNSLKEAQEAFDYPLDKGVKTIEKIGVVKDAARWPQEISHYTTVVRIEYPDVVISYSE